MPYCPNCGVELAAKAHSCPLCGTSATASLEEATREAAAKASVRHRGDSLFDPEDREKLSDSERRTIRWEILSVSIIIALVGVLGVNLLAEGNLTWALYPAFSLVFIWVLLTAFIRLQKKPAIAGLIACFALLGFFLTLDLVDGSLDWAPLIAIPIALITEISAALAVFAGVRAKRKGANLIAFALMAVTTTCLGIEGTLEFQLGGTQHILWSGIVAAALLPVSAFLFYIHHRVNKVANLRRLFRL
jgi:hypothetical protein